MLLSEIKSVLMVQKSKLSKSLHNGTIVYGDTLVYDDTD